MIDEYYALCIAGKQYEEQSDIMAKSFRELLPNSVADVVDYPVATYNTIYKSVTIMISCNNRYIEDLEEALSQIEVIENYETQEGDNYVNYYIHLSREKIIDLEMKQILQQAIDKSEAELQPATITDVLSDMETEEDDE